MARLWDLLKAFLLRLINGILGDVQGRVLALNLSIRKLFKNVLNNQTRSINVQLPVKTELFLPDKSSPRSHHIQPSLGNLGQGHSYLLRTRQLACPGRRRKHQTVYNMLISIFTGYTAVSSHALSPTGYTLITNTSSYCSHLKSLKRQNETTFITRCKHLPQICLVKLCGLFLQQLSVNTNYASSLFPSIKLAFR